jgi:uncharacterized protein YegP (UPF0339 family)
MTIKLQFAVYKDRKGEFRWRCKRAGQIVADGSEGYSSRSHANRALTHFLKAMSSGKYEVIKP